jgi:transcriptional regulator with XRE-family HTH domain
MRPDALLRTVRRRQGLTQAQLAARAGTSQPVVSAYERGRRDPTFETLRRLVAAAGERLTVDAQRPSGAPPEVDEHERAQRLHDVLLLADAIPARVRPTALRAPRLVSR